MKERVWSLKTLQGGTVEIHLTYSAVQALPQTAKNPFKVIARNSLRVQWGQVMFGFHLRRCEI